MIRSIFFNYDKICTNMSAKILNFVNKKIKKFVQNHHFVIFLKSRLT